MVHDAPYQDASAWFPESNSRIGPTLTSRENQARILETCHILTSSSPNYYVSTTSQGFMKTWTILFAVGPPAETIELQLNPVCPIMISVPFGNFLGNRDSWIFPCVEGWTLVTKKAKAGKVFLCSLDTEPQEVVKKIRAAEEDSFFDD